MKRRVVFFGVLAFLFVLVGCGEEAVDQDDSNGETENSSAPESNQEQDFGLPAVDVLNTASFAHSYGCESGDYETSALFLSELSEEMNNPELLYGGPCSGLGTFSTNTSVGDMGLIADLGDQPIEDLDLLLEIRDTSEFYPRVDAVEGHSYLVVLTTPRVRTVYAFSVVGFGDDEELEIEYKVASFEVIFADEETNADSDIELDTVATESFAAGRSCVDDVDEAQLFLDSLSEEYNSPSMYYEGNCTTDETFRVNTVVGQVSLIADLGDVALSEVDVDTDLKSAENRFAEEQPVVEGHTYLVVISKNDEMGYFAFHVEEYTEGGAATIEYTVGQHDYFRVDGEAGQ